MLVSVSAATSGMRTPSVASSTALLSPTTTGATDSQPVSALQASHGQDLHVLLFWTALLSPTTTVKTGSSPVSVSVVLFGNLYLKHAQSTVPDYNFPQVPPSPILSVLVI